VALKKGSGPPTTPSRDQPVTEGERANFWPWGESRRPPPKIGIATLRSDAFKPKMESIPTGRLAWMIATKDTFAILISDAKGLNMETLLFRRRHAKKFALRDTIAMS